MLALRLDCSTAALTTHQKVLPIWKLVELKMLDFSDRMRTGISILTKCNGHSTMFHFHAAAFVHEKHQGRDENTHMM